MPIVDSGRRTARPQPRGVPLKTRDESRAAVYGEARWATLTRASRRRVGRRYLDRMARTRRRGLESVPTWTRQSVAWGTVTIPRAPGGPPRRELRRWMGSDAYFPFGDISHDRFDGLKYRAVGSAEFYPVRRKRSQGRRIAVESVRCRSWALRSDRIPMRPVDSDNLSTRFLIERCLLNIMVVTSIGGHLLCTTACGTETSSRLRAPPPTARAARPLAASQGSVEGPRIVATTTTAADWLRLAEHYAAQGEHLEGRRRVS